MLKDIIATATLKKEADVILKNGKIVNVFTEEIITSNIALSKNKIAGIGKDYIKGEKVIDLGGKYVIPGLIDGHVHIESSYLSVPEFAKATVPHGTTTVIIDPHEIANVLGIKGVKYMLDSSENIPLSVFVMVPSCVPATPFETAGATLDALDVEKILKLDRVLGLAEMMNYPGVIGAFFDVLKKIEITQKMRKIIDGHAPGLSGKKLEAYVGAGISSDHECTTKKEAYEKLGLGMRIMIREGSAAKNMKELLKMVNQKNSRRCFFVTDDRHPSDIINEGHMDHILRKAVRSSLNPIAAVKMATLNTAEYFSLKNYGAVAPGYIADLVVVNNLRNFKVFLVIKDGKIVAKNGKTAVAVPPYKKKTVKGTINVAPLFKDRLQIRLNKDQKVKVIGLIPNQIVTKKLILNVKTKDGRVISDTKRDILKLAVVERHQRTGNVGIGLIKGLGLKRGAIASSVAHDSHNIIVCGVNDEDMVEAVKSIKKMEGGQVVVAGEKVVASLPLPIAGLMSDKDIHTVEKMLKNLHVACKKLGVITESPFAVLSFCALPVIPELRLTDKGLFDVTKFSFTDIGES